MTRTQDLPQDLPPEPQEGNVEYKLKLVDPSPARFEHLVTQMKWRLAEGQGEAIYEIGVEDCGRLAGLLPPDMESSLETLRRMAESLKADTTVLRERQVEGGRLAVEVLVRKLPDECQFPEITIAVVGHADAGKSTLLGYLTHGELDNGRGRARLNLFRHKHEVETGRTSSISREILGFDSKGQIVNHSEHGAATWEQIMVTAAKVVSFIDLAGHQKYLGTTVTGMTGYRPTAVMVVIAGNTGVLHMTCEHLGLAVALGLPLFVVVTKIDTTPQPLLARTMAQVHRILKMPGCKKVPMEVDSEDDAIMAASSFVADRVAPVFQVSCVTGSNMHLLHTFLNLIPFSSALHVDREAATDLPEYQIEETFNVAGVGTVVGGMVVRGAIHSGQTLLLGPDLQGAFHPVVVQSVRRNRTPYRYVSAGQMASLALGPSVDRGDIRKGMVLVSPDSHPQACVEFEAESVLLCHPRPTITPRFQVLMYISGVRQCASIISIHSDDGCLRVGDRVPVRYRLANHPEYLRPGMDLLFRDQRTKGIGKITTVFPLDTCSK